MRIFNVQKLRLSFPRILENIPRSQSFVKCSQNAIDSRVCVSVCVCVCEKRKLVTETVLPLGGIPVYRSVHGHEFLGQRKKVKYKKKNQIESREQLVKVARLKQ